MDVSTRSLRRLWFWFHMIIGVALTVVLIPLSLSGSYLVWRSEIDRATHPARFAVSAQHTTLAPSAYLDAAQAAFGDKAMAAAVRLPANPGDPVTVTGTVGKGDEGGGHHKRVRAEGADRPAAAPSGAPQRRPMLTAWLDPATARVLDVANPREGFSMWVHDLHGQLFIFGGVGRQVVGWFGWAMLVSCLTGIWLWWPRSASPLLGLRWRRSTDALMNWHRRVGIWIAVPLAVLCLTGALIAFPPVARGIAGAFGPVTPPRPGGPSAPGGAPVRHAELTADQAGAMALGAAPGATLAAVTLPVRGADTPAWRVQLRKGEAQLNVSVEDTEGGAARIAPERPRAGGDQLIRLNRQLHGGDDTPLLWKLIITVAGLAPALLGVTGLIVWARRQFRKTAMRRRLAGATAEPAPAE